MREWCKKYNRTEKRREYMREYNKKYREEHREELNFKLREYHSKRREKNKEYCEKYREEHKEELKEYAQEYRKTKRGRSVALSAAYKAHDNRKNYDTSQNIDSKWIEDNIFSGQECFYCGESDWAELGVDRIDNSKPHTPDNCVCSCWDCNNRRKNKYSVEEFKLLIEKEKGGA